MTTTDTLAGKSIRPWSQSEASELSKMAVRQFKCDWAHGQTDEELDNCCACTLRGYRSKAARSDGMTTESGPNVCGWARLYVQASKPIPGRWFGAFLQELNKDNEPYVAALKRDVATFGLRIEPRVFRQ